MSVHTFRQATTENGETRPYRYLTSGATANGKTRRGNGLSFPYPPFEQAALQAQAQATANAAIQASFVNPNAQLANLQAQNNAVATGLSGAVQKTLIANGVITAIKTAFEVSEAARGVAPAPPWQIYTELDRKNDQLRQYILEQTEIIKLYQINRSGGY